jgi:MFS family permease
MFEMTPRQLLRWGVATAAIGNVIVAVAPDYFWVVAGYAVASLGFGFARPGFTAGASLAVGTVDQARIAGAIAAVNGINVILAPGFMWLYRHYHALPFLLNAGLMVAMFVYALLNRRLREADPEPATRADTAMATLERSDEGA